MENVEWKKAGVREWGLANELSVNNLLSMFDAVHVC